MDIGPCNIAGAFFVAKYVAIMKSGYLFFTSITFAGLCFCKVLILLDF